MKKLSTRITRMQNIIENEPEVLIRKLLILDHPSMVMIMKIMRQDVKKLSKL